MLPRAIYHRITTRWVILLQAVNLSWLLKPWERLIHFSPLLMSENPMEYFSHSPWSLFQKFKVDQHLLIRKQFINIYSYIFKVFANLCFLFSVPKERFLGTHFHWGWSFAVLSIELWHPTLHPFSVHAKNLIWGWRLCPGNRHWNFSIVELGMVTSKVLFGSVPRKLPP